MNEVRKRLIAEGRYTDAVNEFIIKICNAKTKKFKIISGVCVMEKSLFEQNGYLLPNITLPEEEKVHIGIWGQRHLCYLKQYRKILYYNLITSGKLNGHLTDIENQAQNMFSKTTKMEGITEQSKEEDQMRWGQLMNNLCNRVEAMMNRNIMPIKPLVRRI